MFSGIERRNWLAWLPIACMAALAISAMAAVTLATPHGAGLSPDSISYIEGARLLADSRSFAGLNAHWPPLYPLLLALAAGPHGGFLFAARLCCIAAAGANLAALQGLLRQGGWGAPAAALLAASVGLDPDLVDLHLMAWSEPVFLFCVLMGMAALHTYLLRGETRHIYAAGLLFGSAALCRYAGVAFIGAAGLMLLYRVVRTRDAAGGVASLARFGLPALLPLATWVASRGAAGGAADVGTSHIRSLQIHFPGADKWIGLGIDIVDWFGGLGNLAFLLCVLVVVVSRWRGNLTPAARSLLAMAAWFGAVYLAFLAVSLSFFDAYIPLDGRILAPFKVLLYLVLYLVLSAVPGRARLAPLALVAAFTFSVTLPSTCALAADSEKNGFGFAQPSFTALPLLVYLREHHVVLNASNAPELTLLYLDRRVPMLPATLDPTTNLPSPAFAQELGKLARPGATVALFAPLMWRSYLPKVEQLRQAGFSETLYLRADGVVLRHP